MAPVWHTEFENARRIVAFSFLISAIRYANSDTSVRFG